MPRNSNSKGSDEDGDYKRKNDYNYEEDVKSTSAHMQASPRKRAISINVATLPVANSITPTLPSTTTARNHTAVNSLKTHFTITSCFRVPAKTGEDPE